MKKKLPKLIFDSINNARVEKKLKKISKEEKDREYKFYKINNIEYYSSLRKKVEKSELNKSQEHYKKICKLFNLKKNIKIKIIIVNDRKQMFNLIGRETNGTTGLFKKGKEKYGIVFSIFTYHPHEITHSLINFNFNYPNDFFSEGLATLYGWNNEEFKGKHIDIHTKELINSRKLNIRKLMDNNHFRSIESKLTYPYSASFLKYIRERYGFKKLKEVFKKIKKEKTSKENIKILEICLSKNITLIQKDFNKYILN